MADQFQGIISGTEHIQSMSEIPSFFVAVPSPAGIRVGIMASAGASVWAGLSACWKMSPVRGGMGNHGSAITGDGEVVGIDQSKAQGREDGKDGKDLLKSRFRIFGGGFSIQDTVDDIPGSNGGRIFRFCQFAIRPDFLFWFLAIFAGGEQRGSGITIPWRQPEAVHKIIIGTEGRQFFGGRAADKDGKRNGFWKNFPHP